MKAFLTLTALSLLLSQLAFHGVNGLAIQPNPDILKYVPTHIIKLKPNNNTGFEPTAFIHQHFNTFQQNYPTLLQSIKPNPPPHLTSLQPFHTLIGRFDPAFLTYLTQLDDIDYVEPNAIYRSGVMPVTHQPKPYRPIQLGKKLKKREMMTQEDVPSWGLARINQRQMDDTTTYTVEESASHGIHVYVLDSGISTDHPDFEGRAIFEANFIDYEEDIDYAGHGTHVAGTIAGKSFGVAKNVVIHAIKILDRNGDGTTSALLQAISHIIEVAQAGRTIINLSLTGPRSSTIDDALSMAVKEHGIPVFASAGNSGDNACDYSPSANPDVFTVGASDDQDRVSAFSSFGKCVRLYAPGSNITSSWLNHESQTMDGTSMANPHVTGIAAMLLSQYDFNSPFELYDAITTLATSGVIQSNHDDESKKLLAYYGSENP